MCEDKPPSKNITTLHSYHTEYNADSVEWCPHEPFQNFFVCANYQLIESTEEGKYFVNITSKMFILNF
jgi:hypothetical protein